MVEPTQGAESSKVSLARPTPLADSPSPHRLTINHPDWVGKREDNQLHESDWPDIREMLAKGRHLRTIASDFDVPVETLDAFIAAKDDSGHGKAKQPPGEAHAPLA